ncbi:glycosyltransferase family 4 protein [Tahibacter sp.]|uniref:MraY family glycosyltransferase n=1 Tax=Tahibacter sp. TaxID=2056211 RepID=UPI0028C47228|nr:glycosyltransferase family 4 protein [Tahibacter sp.]
MDFALVLHAASALLISSSATVLALRYAQRRRLLDGPGRRRAHSVPTPRGGGIAIVVSALCCVGPVLAPVWAAALLGLALVAVAGVGWWDDHASLGPLPRVVVHLLAGVALAVVVLRIAPLPAWANGLVVVLGLAVVLSTAWSINLHNFMDGINGFLTLQALWIFSMVAVLGELGLPHGLGAIPALLAAACLGFLPFNFPRARIFLGDVGSGALGFLIIAVLWLAAMREPRWFAVGLLLLSSFLIDATATLSFRFWRGRRWYSAHREHLYQWLVRRGWSHSRIVARYMAWNLLLIAPFALFAGLFDDENDMAPVIAVVTAYTAGLLIWRRSRRAILREVRAHA